MIMAAVARAGEVTLPLGMDRRDRLRIGVAGMGRAFMIMVPTLRAHPRIHVVAGADPRDDARARFEADFAARTYATVDALCADPDVQAIYVATPHELHAGHVRTAARAGKHVLVEKPMAITLAQCDAMIAAARDAGIVLMVGHSHSFDAPVLRTRALIDSGRYGGVRMIAALQYTDFLYRPRRPEELDTRSGGGAVFSQGAHHVDVARLLAGAPVRSVRAATLAWDATRPTEGGYTAFVTFENGAVASLTYSGYGHFDSDEFCGWIGELGQSKDPGRHGAMRALLRQARTPADEEALKHARGYGARAADAPPAVGHNHFGLVLVSCDQADLRPLADAVMVYGNDMVERLPVDPPVVPRAEVFDEFCDAVAGVRPALHTGEWARATLAVCLAILQSARENREVEVKEK
jgi:phthalate 4,5-cis-dihydrodiol dehydrogenase